MTPSFKLSYLSLALLLGNALNAHAAQELHNFNLPAQPLSATLNQLAQSGQTKLVYADKAVQGLTAEPVKGNYTVAQALQLALGKTDLGYEVVDNKVIAVKPEKKAAAQVAQDSDPTVLETVNVVDKAKRDVTDPYNPDYVLPNATAGTKTDTPIMETPLNVQVISKQVLKDQQVINLGDALKNFSGVTTSSNGGGPYGGSHAGTQELITLRGFASNTYFRNGFRLTEGSSSRNMSNIESVEVAKGPAAILYGFVEPGGMVNVTTKQPLATPYYSLNQQFGSFSDYRTTVDATGPLTKDDTLLYRLNASYQNSGSFQDSVHKEDFFIAPVLKWNISPRTQATLEFEYNHQNLATTTGFRPIINGQIIDLSRKLNYGERAPGTVETFYGGFNWSHAFNDDWQVKHHLSINQSRTKLNMTFPNGTTDTTTSRLIFGRDTQVNTYATSIDLTGHFKTMGLEHTLLMGGDYYRVDYSASQFAISDPTTFFAITDIGNFNPVHTGVNYAGLEKVLTGTIVTDQYGFYVQDQIKLPYDVHVMGGIRYQNFHQSLDNETFAFFAGPPDIAASHNDAVTPRVGILWQPQKWLSLYANYVESFGVNDGRIWLSDTQFKLAPATGATQYEGGIKTEFFNGRLRTNLAYFDLTKTNVATSDPAHYGFSLVTGAVQSRGYEFDVTGEILPGWNAIANYSYTDAIITKSNEVDSSSNSTAFGKQGSRYWGVPRNTARVWNTYEFQQGNLLGLKFGGGVTVRSGQVACCNDPAYTIPGYATVDLLAGYSHKVGKSKVTLQLNVDNLLDKHYYTSLNTVPYTNAAFLDFGKPRTFMGSLKIEY